MDLKPWCLFFDEFIPYQSGSSGETSKNSPLINKAKLGFDSHEFLRLEIFGLVFFWTLFKNWSPSSHTAVLRDVLASLKVQVRNAPDKLYLAGYPFSALHEPLSSALHEPLRICVRNTHTLDFLQAKLDLKFPAK